MWAAESRAWEQWCEQGQALLSLHMSQLIFIVIALRRVFAWRPARRRNTLPRTSPFLGIIEITAAGGTRGPRWAVLASSALGLHHSDLEEEGNPNQQPTTIDRRIDG